MTRSFDGLDESGCVVESWQKCRPQVDVHACFLTNGSIGPSIPLPMQNLTIRPSEAEIAWKGRPSAGNQILILYTEYCGSHRTSDLSKVLLYSIVPLEVALSLEEPKGWRNTDYYLHIMIHLRSVCSISTVASYCTYSAGLVSP